MVSIRNSRVQVVIRDTKEQFYGYQEVITSPRRLFYGRRVVMEAEWDEEYGNMECEYFAKNRIA